MLAYTLFGSVNSYTDINVQVVIFLKSVRGAENRNEWVFLKLINQISIVLISLAKLDSLAR